MHLSTPRRLLVFAAGSLLALAACGPDSATTDDNDRATSTSGRIGSAVTQGTCSGSPALCSAWEPELVSGFPADVAIHMHLLPTGEVLFWPGHEGLGKGRKRAQYAYLWNPETGTYSQVDNNRTDIFCSGHAFLPNGSLLVAGGHLGDDMGSPDVNIFDPFRKRWSRAPAMNAGRWYPTVTALASGEALVIAGRDENKQFNAVPQVFSTANGGKWRSLTGATRTMGYPYYPFTFQAPNGQVFYAGPEPTLSYLNTAGTGSWSTAGSSLFGWRDYGTAVMYAPGRILLAGGGGDWKGGSVTATAEVIDISGGGASASYTGSMNYPRRHLNATVLPDGKVLVTGGTSAAGHNNEEGAVRMAEIWDPATNVWRTLTEEMKPRTYHGLALLLPDGRVLSAGSGRCGGCDVDQTNAQIFWPPYLFNGDGTLATRPTITSAPARVAYGASFTVATPDAASIARVSLVRLGSVTHAFDENQRFVPATFTATASGLTVSAPGDRNIAPPGHYLLFILNGSGVPSRAKIVQLL